MARVGVSVRVNVRVRDGARGAAVIAVALVCLLVAACGGASTGVGGGTPHATPTLPSRTPTQPATALNGCAWQTPPVGLPAADVVARPRGGENTPPVSLHVGQTLQIRLPATYRWSLPAQDVGRVLAPQPGNDWLDANASASATATTTATTTANACVWQFSASAVGHATLNFTGSPVCPPGSPCPAYAVVITQDVTVAA